MNIEQNSQRSDWIYDVLIVGAGPVGLATAIGLRQRGIENILVIDRTHDFRRVGQIVDILPNGLKALKYIDLQAYEQVKAAELNLLAPPTDRADAKTDKPPQQRAWHQKNFQGKITRSIPLEITTWCDLYGEGRASLQWFDLQTILRNLLPSEIVRVNHRCIEMSQRNDCLQINCITDRAANPNPFAHWEMQPVSSSAADLTSPMPNTSVENTEPIDSAKRTLPERQFRAKLVVAADGINSTLRQSIYQNSELSEWATPDYSGFSAIGCLEIENVPESMIQELERKYFQGARMVTLADDIVAAESQAVERPRLRLIRRAENTIGYLLHTPLSLDSLENKSSAEIVELAVDILKTANFPQIFHSLIQLSNSDKLIYRPYYIHPTNIPASQPIWSSGRVVLVGDAAHGMPPFTAQGANQGFEDAATISALIAKAIDNNLGDDDQSIADLFGKYERLRRPVLLEVQAATMKSHSWSQADWDIYNDRIYRRDLGRLIDDLL